jgi:hypothetical protein
MAEVDEGLSATVGCVDRLHQRIVDTASANVAECLNVSCLEVIYLGLQRTAAISGGEPDSDELFHLSVAAFDAKCAKVYYKILLVLIATA